MIEITKRTVLAAKMKYKDSKSSVKNRTYISGVDRFDNKFAITKMEKNCTLESIYDFSFEKDINMEENSLLTSEAKIHQAIYREFPQINFIIHTYAVNISYFAQAGKPIPIYNINDAAYFKEEIACVQIENEDNTDLAEAILKAMKGREISSSGALLVSKEGALVWNETPYKAWDLAVQLDDAAKNAVNTQILWKDNCQPLSDKHARKYYDEQQSITDRDDTRGEPGTAVTSKQLKSINLGLLRYFDEVCRKNDIKYSLTGGSLIGAIRHCGMIPWDDDVDVFLTRPEYEKLLAAFPDDHERYEFVNLEKDPEYNYVFGRLIDKWTMVNWSYNVTSQGRGLNLDVCVVDGLPKTELAREQNMKHMRFLFRCRRASIPNPNSKHYYEKGPIVRAMKRTLCFFTDHHFWNRIIDKEMRKYDFNESEFVGNFTSQYGNKELMHHSSFDEYYDVKFEDMTCMVCAGYEEYLNNIYKNYLKFPPAKKQKGHHDTDAVWL